MNQEKATFLPDELRIRNKEIEKIYFKILKEIAELSRSFPDPKLRVRIEIDLKHYPRTENEVFELLTPYVYLLLMKSDEGQLRISYAINDNAVACLGQLYFTQLIRIIYSHTIRSKAKGQDSLEVLPYYCDIYEEARHFAIDCI